MLNKIRPCTINGVGTSFSNSDFDNFQSQSPISKTPNKGRFFRVLAILVDRGIFPRCLGQSEDALRLYLYECSAVGKFGTHRAGPAAAKKYLGFDEDRYRRAKKELVKARLVFRHKFAGKKDSSQDDKKRKSKFKYWGISNPPLLKIDEDNSSICLFKPEPEPKTGYSALFHLGKTGFEFIRVSQELVYIKGCHEMKSAICPLAKMSVDEIYCYLNLVCQNRESWYGLNPNYVRYELSLERGIVHKFDSLGAYLFPAEEYGDSLQISPVLIEKTGMSKDKLKEIINSLVRQGFFEWRYWIAQHTTYFEKRREKKMTQLKLIYYLDYEQMGTSSQCAVSEIASIVRSNKRFKLIAQLRSCLELNPQFELLCNLNCAFRAFTKHIKSHKRTDYSEKKNVDVSASAQKQSDDLDKYWDEMERRTRSRRQEATEEVIEEIAKDLCDDSGEGPVRDVDFYRDLGAGIDFSEI